MDERRSLPSLQVLNILDEFKSGSNNPLLVGAVDEATGVKEKCVLKPNGGERMSKKAMLREIAATFIAKTWGIHTVEPVLLRVTPQLVEANVGQDWYDLLQKSVGLNYGSVYLPNHQIPVLGQALNATTFGQAQMIFAFDLFVQNPDRRSQKPNLMSNGEQLVIFDHELAFSYLQLFFPSKQPWQISGEEWIEDMFLYPIVKGKPLPEDLIKQNVDKINTHFWDNLDQALPEELLILEEYAKIKQFCTAVVDHADAFIQELQIVAA